MWWACGWRARCRFWRGGGFLVSSCFPCVPSPYLLPFRLTHALMLMRHLCRCIVFFETLCCRTTLLWCSLRRASSALNCATAAVVSPPCVPCLLTRSVLALTCYLSLLWIFIDSSFVVAELGALFFAVCSCYALKWCWGSFLPLVCARVHACRSHGTC